MKKVYVFIVALIIAFLVGREIIQYQRNNFMKLEYKRLVKEKLAFSAIEEKLYSLPKGFGSDRKNLYRAKLNQVDADRLIVQAKKEWHSFPFTEELQLLMYGGYKDGVWYDYNFADTGLPVIERGYWKLISKESIELVKKNLFNFSLYIIDTDNTVHK